MLLLFLLCAIAAVHVTPGGFLSEIGGVCRVNGNLNLSRAIGDLKYKGNTELPPKDQIITAQPDVMKVALQVRPWARGGAKGRGHLHCRRLLVLWAGCGLWQAVSNTRHKLH